MTTADRYRLNAANCAMVETVENEPDRNRFKCMEAAWRALAEEQDWLEREKRNRPPAERIEKIHPVSGDLLALSGGQPASPTTVVSIASRHHRYRHALVVEI
jgi:hypothetical protein